MNLANNRFSSHPIRKGFILFEGTDRESVHATPYTRYSYEAHNGLYDVDVRDSDGDKTYHMNMGFETEATPIHKRIETHFGI